MLRLSTRTKLSPEEIGRRAVTFFGPGGYGLAVTELAPGSTRFEGGGGQVEVTACRSGGETSVELKSREWDYQLREFADKIR